MPKALFHAAHDRPGPRALAGGLAAAFSLIIPHSDMEVGRFRLLGATLGQMPGWCNDLSYACALSSVVANLWRPSTCDADELEALFAGRASWLACNCTDEEEAALPAAHGELAAEFKGLLTVFVPRDGTRGAAAAAAFGRADATVAFMSGLPPTRAPLRFCRAWPRRIMSCRCSPVGLWCTPSKDARALALLACFFSTGPIPVLCTHAHQQGTGASLHATETLRAAVDGVDVLVVDVPWALPLLLSTVELAFLGGSPLPGDQNYALLGQAALSSCAVVATAGVAAHAQLAQELNGVAVSAAEDTAHAVRTAGAPLHLGLCVILPARDHCASSIVTMHDEGGRTYW